MSYRPPISQADVEQRMVDVDDALAEATNDYAVLCDDAAEAEADYKEHLARALLAVAQTGTGGTVSERQARADLICAEEFRAFKVADARRQSCREALLSYRSRLDALRTLNANIRAVTTHS